MSETAKQAMMWSLVAELYAVQAMIEAMKAENNYRADHGSAPAYTEDAFADEANKLRRIAGKLRELAS